MVKVIIKDQSSLTEFIKTFALSLQIITSVATFIADSDAQWWQLWAMENLRVRSEQMRHLIKMKAVFDCTSSVLIPTRPLYGTRFDRIWSQLRISHWFDTSEFKDSYATLKSGGLVDRAMKCRFLGIEYYLKMNKILAIYFSLNLQSARQNS